MEKGMFEVEEDDCLLLAGRRNGGNETLFWTMEDCKVDGYSEGDYAIVENMNDFDLVKIVGTVVTKKNLANLFSKTKYEHMKKVIRIVNKSDLIKEDKQ